METKEPNKENLLGQATFEEEEDLDDDFLDDPKNRKPKGKKIKKMKNFYDR